MKHLQLTQSTNPSNPLDGSPYVFYNPNINKVWIYLGLNWILEDGSSHYIEYRNVSKVVEEDVNDSSAFGVNFYGVVINEPCESKYFMLCNSVISHDSSVDY